MDRDLWQDELTSFDDIGRLRTLRMLGAAQGTTVTIDGRSLINMSSNDYLGMTSCVDLRNAASKASLLSGTGSGSSRLIAGTLLCHEQLEQALADYYGYDKALIFNSGYQANLGILSSLFGQEDVIYSDAFNHASIIDGARLSYADVKIFPHNDMEALEALLAETRSQYRHGVIVTEALFSMDGDYAQLSKIAALAKQYDLLLMVDEAHSTGVIGDGGRGLSALHSVVPDIYMGTMGKAFGSFGAFVLGRVSMIDLLINKARSFVFTTALPPPVIEASGAALKIIGNTDGEQRRSKLVRLVKHFVSGLHELYPERHYDNHSSHIIPLIFGEDKKTMSATTMLLEHGYYVQGIRPPTVPEHTSRLRFSLNAEHTEQDINNLLKLLDKLRKNS